MIQNVIIQKYYEQNSLLTKINNKRLYLFEKDMILIQKTLLWFLSFDLKSKSKSYDPKLVMIQNVINQNLLQVLYIKFKQKYIFWFL